MAGPGGGKIDAEGTPEREKNIAEVCEKGSSQNILQKSDANFLPLNPPVGHSRLPKSYILKCKFGYQVSPPFEGG